MLSINRGGKRRGRKILATIGALVLFGSFGSIAAYASHPEASLPGSNFEIDVNANLKQDDASPSIDWASVTENRRPDLASGSNDTSFTQGSKEDTAVPTVEFGSIPPNKSDLKFFGVYQEGNTSSGFLNLYWTRVQDPSGTTNMDFEFNQSATASSNGVTPVRTAGDLLITYDLSRGGVVPILSLRTWTGSAWGPAVNLTSSGSATGSINSSAIPAGESDGLSATGLDPRTFGEAQLALSAIFPNPDVCQTFGAAYLKSRSSDSFTAALKDFIAPTSVNITNCGSIEITKTDDATPPSPLSGATFQLYQDNAPIGGSRGNEDTLLAGKTCTTDDTGICTIVNVLAGEYWVVESVTPPGYDTAPDQHASVPANQQVLLSFVDPRQNGAILVTKLRKHAAGGPGDHPQSGVDFTVNGVKKTTDASGQVCFDGLLFDDYLVHETTPAGYAGEADKTVTVDNKASCPADPDDPYVGETVTFNNMPLTNIAVSVDSRVDGGTASTIVCKDADDKTVASGTTNAAGDGSASASDLVPGTYTCTLVIDP